MSGTTNQVIRQKRRTESELRADGFRYYERKKLLIMVRRMSDEESPKIIDSGLYEMVATKGYFLCYQAGDTLHATLDEYGPWPVHPDNFAADYKPWDEPGWSPSPAEAHIMSLGCQPYYKYMGVWAKKLTTDIYVQTLESPHPAHVPAGQWLLVGTLGEPYCMSEENLWSRYIKPEN
jgi:hypothetical protein